MGHARRRTARPLMTTTTRTTAGATEEAPRWITYRCTGCGRTEIQRADVLAVTCHRLTEHPTPRVHRMRPTEEATR
jgi:hypothetical protein